VAYCRVSLSLELEEEEGCCIAAVEGRIAAVGGSFDIGVVECNIEVAGCNLEVVDCRGRIVKEDGYH
jgi:hypothetical protein